MKDRNFIEVSNLLSVTLCNIESAWFGGFGIVATFPPTILREVLSVLEAFYPAKVFKLRECSNFFKLSECVCVC